MVDGHIYLTFAETSGKSPYSIMRSSTMAQTSSKNEIVRTKSEEPPEKVHEEDNQFDKYKQADAGRDPVDDWIGRTHSE